LISDHLHHLLTSLVIYTLGQVRAITRSAAKFGILLAQMGRATLLRNMHSHPESREQKYRHFWSRYAFFLLSLISLAAYALSSDNDLPMSITSDKLDFNNKTGITIFTGNVKMDQGTTHLRADKVTVYKQPDGEIDKIVALGKQAHYSTLPETGKDVMDAFGNSIEYYPKKKQAIILGDGAIKQGKNIFTAQHIIYDLAKDTLTSIPTKGSPAKLILHPEEVNP
jgi:lipopolysaccharide export system protein LptA